MSSGRLHRLLREARKPPVVSTDQLITKSAGLLYTSGGIAALISSTMHPGASGGNRLYVAIAGLVSIGTGIVIYTFHNQVSRVALNVTFAGGNVLIAVASYYQPTDILALVCAGFVVYMACLGLFLSWCQAALHLAVGMIGIIISLSLRNVELGSAAWLWIFPFGSVAATLAVLVRLASETMVDPLTGLLNRKGLDTVLDDLTTSRHHKRLSLAVLDIDGLKQVNDAGGLSAGDSLLRTTVEEWAQHLDDAFTLARVGGDEFALLMPDTTEEAAQAIVDTLRSEVNTCNFSAGVTSSKPGESASLLFGRADAGVYTAKNSGRGRTVIQSATQSDLSRALQEAVRRSEIDVHFQPMIDLSQSGSPIVGIEALARWVGPDGSYVSPETFLRIAEEDGFMVDLGHVIARKAFENAVRFHNVTGQKVPLFLNSSGLEMVNPDYVPALAQIMRQTGLAPEDLVVEVTETTLDSDSPDAMKSIADLRLTGVRMAIDDFGTGYSSLSRLHSLPVDYLKLDRSFVAGVDSETSSPLLPVIAAMGAAMHLPIVAEGVEHQDQADLLAQLGYAIAQGWLYFRAMPMDALLDIVDDPALTNRA